MEPMTRQTPRWLLLGATLCLGLLLAFAATAVTQVSAQAGLISGTVVDPDGGLPSAGTVVHLVKPGGPLLGTAQIDAGGGFNLGPVPNGAYVLVAKPPQASPFTNSLPKAIEMTGGAVDAGALALTQPDIVGTVVAPDGATPTSAFVNVANGDHIVQVSPAPDGAIKIGGLISGSYGLRAIPAPGIPLWKSTRLVVDVTAGVSQTVQLELRPANVVGTAVDPNGVPVGNATAHVWGITTNTYRQDKSGPNGGFALGALPPDSFVLVLEPPLGAGGLAPPEPPLFNVPPDFHDLGVVAFRGAPKIVEGAVTTNVGQPVSQALVVANRLDHPGHDQALTGPNGHYQMNLSGGLWSITVHPTPLSVPRHWLNPNPPQIVHFDPDLEPEQKVVNFNVLTADSTVSGIVELPDGGTPTFSVTVKLHNSEGQGTETLVDPADGGFLLHVPHGVYNLIIQPQDPGYAGPAPRPIVAPANGGIELGVLTLIAKDATVNGAVVDDGGEGVGGVHVVAWAGEYQSGRVETDMNGEYVMNVAPGDYLVRPVVPAHLPFIYAGEPVSVSVAHMERVTLTEFVLTSADNVIAGQLLDGDGLPVNAYGWAGAADESGPVNAAPIIGGAFAIFVPDGAFDVQVRLAPGSEWLPGPPQSVAVSGGETVSLTVPLLPRDATIAGALWDPRDEVVPTGVNGHVLAFNPFAAVGGAINPGNGTYSLDVSAGLWHLGYHVDPSSGYVALDHHTIVPLESGQTVVKALQVTQRDAVLAGTVLDPDGAPVPGAVVAADGFGVLNQVTLRTISGDDGRFVIPVPYGTYRLRAGNANPAWLNPVLRTVTVHPNQIVDGLTLQFRAPDATLTGVTSLGDGLAGPVDAEVRIWAYTDDGAATQTTAPLGELYELNLLSGVRWHIGAALETSSSFYVVRGTIALSGTSETLDLVLGGPFPKPGPVTVTFDANEPVELTLADGTQIFIPAGAMPASGGVTLHAVPIATFPHQHHARLYKYGYAFVATDETGAPITASFNQNVIISFSYDEAELIALGLKEAHLKPAYYSTTTQSWTLPASYVVDTAHNRVVLQIDHFTDYTLLNSGATELFLPATFRK